MHKKFKSMYLFKEDIFYGSQVFKNLNSVLVNHSLPLNKVTQRCIINWIDKTTLNILKNVYILKLFLF